MAGVRCHRTEGGTDAPGTVDTVPEKTLLAYADHGVTCELMQPDHVVARRCSMQCGRQAWILMNWPDASNPIAWNELLDSIQTKLTN